MKFKTFKRCGLLLVAIVSFTACNDNDDPADDMGIVGKWQKFQVMDGEGNFSEGDLDEFWIFNVDGSFKNEDGGNLTTSGCYIVEGSKLMIYSKSVDDPSEEENFSGNFIIDNNFMTYSFTDMKDGEKSTIRFKKM